MSMQDQIQFLKKETEELHAMQFAYGLVIASLIATHPDKPSFLRQLHTHREELATNPKVPLHSAQMKDLALQAIDWLALDTPPKIW